MSEEASRFQNVQGRLTDMERRINDLCHIVKAITEDARLDRIEAALADIQATMLQRSDLNESNRTPRSQEEWEAVMRGEHREGGE